MVVLIHILLVTIDVKGPFSVHFYHKYHIFEKYLFQPFAH